MTPLELMDVVWTATAQANVMFILDGYRVDERHELFDLSSPQALEDVEQAKRIVLYYITDLVQTKYTESS